MLAKGGRCKAARPQRAISGNPQYPVLIDWVQAERDRDGRNPKSVELKTGLASRLCDYDVAGYHGSFNIKVWFHEYYM